MIGNQQATVKFPVVTVELLDILSIVNGKVRVVVTRTITIVAQLVVKTGGLKDLTHD